MQVAGQSRSRPNLRRSKCLKPFKGDGLRNEKKLSPGSIRGTTEPESQQNAQPYDKRCTHCGQSARFAMSLPFQVLGGPTRDNALFVRVETGQAIHRLLFDCGEAC